MTQLAPIGFESPYPTAISQVSRTGWRLIDHIVWHGVDAGGNPVVVETPAGQDSDFASSPAALWSVYPPYGEYTAAAITHDRMWRVEVPAGRMTYRDADRHLRDMLRSCGEPWLRCQAMWAAVRWGSLLTRPGGHEGWLKDAPAVLALTVVALPFVLVAGGANTAVRALFWLAERAVEPAAPQRHPRWVAQPEVERGVAE